MLWCMDPQKKYPPRASFPPSWHLTVRRKLKKIEGDPTLGYGRMPPPSGPLMTPGPLDAFPPRVIYWSHALIPALALRTIRVERDAMVDDQIDVAALKAGDAAAFRAVVTSLQDRVYRTCFGFLRNQQEAEDAAQEVFIEVFDSVKDFRQEAQLSTWVHRIAVTKSMEAIRRKRRKKRLAFLVPERANELEQEPAQDPSDSSNPSAALENAEREQVLRQALDSLPDSQRVAFTLHQVEGLSYDEITKVLGNSLSAVESLIHRAKKNLQERLYDYYSKERE